MLTWIKVLINNYTSYPNVDFRHYKYDWVTATLRIQLVYIYDYKK